ncbi:MAG: hypothetical protein U0Q16_02635 [Bryobacteraceae bacterium]
MKRNIFCLLCSALCALGIAWACGSDDAIREYLSVYFWLPLVKGPGQFARSKVKEPTTPFAGMGKVESASAVAKLRAAYQGKEPREDPEQLADQILANPQLSARDHEEAELVKAKLLIRTAESGDAGRIREAKTALTAFLGKAKSADFLSEARGWLGRAHYLAGEQAAAGKIYLDELNRPDTVLGRETLVTSLRVTFEYDGGQELRTHLEEYFDTPEHAAFAIQLVTNPRWNRERTLSGIASDPVVAPPTYTQIKELLEKHSGLLASGKGANSLAVLSMRTALRAGDPAAGVKLAAKVPPRSPIRDEPDFLWMLGSANFLSRRYAAAEAPLVKLFESRRASDDERSAAAYGLCGVYQKLGNHVEQIRYAAWLKWQNVRLQRYLGAGSRVEDMTVYWAVSGWDFGWLVDAEAPIAAMRTFLEKYPKAAGVDLVKYSLAVRLAREEQYEEAATLYAQSNSPRRAARMRRLAELHRATLLEGTDAPAAQYRKAELLSANPEGVYFNDRLWEGFQNYALQTSGDTRFTLAERRRQIALERKLRDDQEELWRAYLILRDVVRQTTDAELKCKAAALAVRSVRLISGRFGREDEIRKADIEMSRVR